MLHAPAVHSARHSKNKAVEEAESVDLAPGKLEKLMLHRLAMNLIRGKDEGSHTAKIVGGLKGIDAFVRNSDIQLGIFSGLTDPASMKILDELVDSLPKDDSQPQAITAHGGNHVPVRHGRTKRPKRQARDGRIRCRSFSSAAKRCFSLVAKRSCSSSHSRFSSPRVLPPGEISASLRTRQRLYSSWSAFDFRESRVCRIFSIRSSKSARYHEMYFYCVDWGSRHA
jgi:hypothetical protein